MFVYSFDFGTTPHRISLVSSIAIFFLTQRCVQILKSSRQISMTVRAPPANAAAPLHGFGPPLGPRGIDSSSSYTQPFRQTCSWMDRHGRPASPPMEYGGRRHERRDRLLSWCDVRANNVRLMSVLVCSFCRMRRVELLIEPGQSLGLMIRGGVEYGLGIFITGVDKDSVADRAGLTVCDLLNIVKLVI